MTTNKTKKTFADAVLAREKKTKKVPEVKVKKAKPELPIELQQSCLVLGCKKKSIKSKKYCKAHVHVGLITETNPNWDKEWQEMELPDSQDTVEQVKDWSRFAPQCGQLLSQEKPSVILVYRNTTLLIGAVLGAILLGAVTGMILSTPLFVKLAGICTQ